MKKLKKAKLGKFNKLGRWFSLGLLFGILSLQGSAPTLTASNTGDVTLFSPDSISQDVLLASPFDGIPSGRPSPDGSIIPLPEIEGKVGAIDITNTISLGDFIVDDRQLLYRMQIVDAEFVDQPALEVIRGLAEAADISYVLPNIETRRISTKLRLPAFKALDLIARNAGLEVVQEGDLWFIRKQDKQALRAEVYKLNNIHLGKSAGTTSDGGTFGSGISGSEASGGTSSTTTTTETAQTGTTTGTGGTSTGGQTGGLLNPLSSRFSEGSDVLTTIKEILGLAAENRLITEEGTEASKATGTTTEQTQSFVSYNADANTLYIIATERQHEWIRRYIDIVDKAVNNISIESIFVESDLNPNEVFGTNWETAGAGFSLRTRDNALSYGSFGGVAFPVGTIIESDGLSVVLRAWVRENRARLARYPRVVTSNNKEVKIQTTTNIPIITQAQTTGLGGSTDSSTTQTDFVTGTQQIGTIITLIPQQINDDMILLKIGIEISSDSGGSGETISGRVATSSTVYEGEMKVPSGKTLAIGGLETISETSNIRRLPWLSEIPVFGFLFKDKEKDFRRTNITLLITPTIMGDYQTTNVGRSNWREQLDSRVLEDVQVLERNAVEADKRFQPRGSKR